jgi:transposase-like protein
MRPGQVVWDETYVKVTGRWTYLYQAVGQHGQVTDVLLSARRGLAAAQLFSTRALCAGAVPTEVTTDRADTTGRPVLRQAERVTLLLVLDLRSSASQCGAS